MIRINKSQNELGEICSEFSEQMIKDFNPKEDKKNRIKEYYITNYRHIISTHFNDFPELIRKFETEFSAEIEEYNKLKSKIESTKGKKEELKATTWWRFTNFMTNRYSSFRTTKIESLDQKISYWLSQKLGVTVCPYCNRQYTFTVDGEQSTRPQYDHFYPKSQYPYLALSFYNLVPSCPECNRLKAEDQVKMHPYFADFGDCKFRIYNIEKKILDAAEDAAWEVGFVKNNLDHDIHIETFALKGLYNGHKDYISEIVIKALSYNEEYLAELKDLLNKDGELNLSNIDIQRIIYGNYILPEDYWKRPLSKLTADILDQLEVKW